MLLFCFPFALLLQASVCDGSKLSPTEADAGAAFGHSVAADGLRLLVGAPGQRETAYLFESDGAQWREASRLEATGDLPDNDLGRAVDLSGDAAILGGPHYDNPLQGDDCEGGVVMIFESTASGWLRVFENYGECDDQLGTSVAIDGSCAAAGMPYRYRVLVFEREATGWTTSAVLQAPDGAPEGFGASVDVEGHRIAVGAPGKSAGRGAVYVFRRTQAGWAVEQEIAPDDALPGDQFGASVELEQGLLYAGMPGRDFRIAHGVDQGEVRVWSASESGWQREGSIHDASLADGARLGTALAVSGTYCLAGAPGARRAFLYDHRGSSWFGAQELASWGDSSSFASSVALAAKRVCFVGDPGDDTSASDAGTVYVFDGTLLSEVYCTCDTGGPCSNDASDAGCASSTGQGACLRACGTSSVLADDLVLLTYSVPPDGTGILFMSLGRIDAGVTFGDGLFCTGGPGARIFRFPARAADGTGSTAEGPGLLAFTRSHFSSEGQILPGNTWHFQRLIRDPSGPCGTGFNLSNGLAVTFLP